MQTDVLIVGAGSAGSVLAERLSVDSSCSVTVLEAGPMGYPRLNDASRLPIGPGSPVVSHFATTLTENPPRAAMLVRGAVVGGSGAINGGYFCRGLPGDFDGWNVPGWHWTDVLPHFRAIETDHDFAGPLHGATGPIPVRRTHELGAGTDAFVQAALSHGFPWIPDLNGEPPVHGIGAVPLNVDRGIRVGPGAAFLEPALQRPNLTLRADTSVRRIVFAGNRAVGVEVLGPSGPVEYRADRIILCCGAIGSARLLMLSGCGPAEDLRRVGVPVLADLPVGVGFTDHPELVLPSGWPASPGRPPTEAVLTLDDLEIRLYTTGFVEMSGGVRSDPPHIGVALMRPKSRGRLRLAAADPALAPVIEHRYDTEAGDVSALHAGVELARDIAQIADQEANWSTTQHLCGTAAIGSVVDPQCRVLGVAGLWVADGSVLPDITSRGPHATIAMIGSRVAEFIRS